MTGRADRAPLNRPEVTQADRDAACALVGVDHARWSAMKQGLIDDDATIVAFARHRNEVAARVEQDRRSCGTACCPNCGEDLTLIAKAILPEATDLTLSLKVEAGQLMRLDTMAGIMSSWRELQIAVGKSMGADTEVFLADMGVRDNEFWFTGRILNPPSDRDRSGEADKTGTGLAEGESPGRETASPHTSPPSSPQAG